MSCDIRQYRSSDLASLIALFQDTVRKVNARDYSDQQVEVLAPDQIDPMAWMHRFATKAVRVAEFNGAPVGFVAVARDGQIDMLYVHADHQGEGIASALLRSAEAWAHSRGLARMFTEATITARPFFERRGFHLIGPQRVIRRALEFISFRMDKLLG